MLKELSLDIKELYNLNEKTVQELMSGDAKCVICGKKQWEILRAVVDSLSDDDLEVLKNGGELKILSESKLKEVNAKSLTLAFD